MKRFNVETHIGLHMCLTYVGVISFPVLAAIAMNYANKIFGFTIRTAVGSFALIGFITIFLPYVYRRGHRLFEKARVEAREKYPGIYRVLALPTEDMANIWKLEPIKLGDFGWEHRPLFKNGLIYLQGLSADWGVVWRAGFRPEQIVYVGPKPVSQYDWRFFDFDGAHPLNAPEWTWKKPMTPCPYPVQANTIQNQLEFPELF